MPPCLICQWGGGEKRKTQCCCALYNPSFPASGELFFLSFIFTPIRTFTFLFFQYALRLRNILFITARLLTANSTSRLCFFIPACHGVTGSSYHKTYCCCQCRKHWYHWYQFTCYPFITTSTAVFLALVSVYHRCISISMCHVQSDHPEEVH